MPLQIRRGNTAEVNSITPLVGELIFNTQTGRVSVGDGVTAGGVPIAGITVNDAKDAAADSLLAGTHKNISFSYDSITKSLSATVDILTHETIEADAIITSKIFNTASTVIVDLDTATINGTLIGNVTGDVKGSIFADDSTLLVDATNATIPASVLTGTFTGNVSGNVTGNIIGDIKGSVFADDSTLLVDAVAGQFFGNLTGDVTGNIITNLISSSDSSAIFVDTPINFETNIQVDGISTFLDELNVTTETINQRLISLTQIHESSSSQTGVNFRRSRGTTASPSIVSNRDNLGNISFTGFDGTIYSQSALIRASTDGTMLSGRIPGRLEFLTISDLTGELTEKMFIGSRNDVRINAELFVNSSFHDPTPMTEFRQAHSTADARNFAWVRSRGTIDAPLAVQNGDGIADLIFSGHDGVNSLPQVSAVIEVVVEGAVTTGRVPGAFFFSTHNGTSLANRVVISSSGLLTALNNLATPNIAPVATNGDLALDPASKGLGTIDFKAPEQSTVGAAGAASALPATPSTYLKVKINGNTYVIPAYLAS